MSYENILHRNIPKSRLLTGLTVSVDPIGGSNAYVGREIRSQEQLDAHGAFATIKGIIPHLPSHIGYEVLFSLADGNHTLDDLQTYTLLGDTTRFTFGTSDSGAFTPTGFRITSENGLVRAAGTTAMSVSTVVDNTVTLTADPSLSANAYNTYYLRVTAGAGVGSIRPIKAHSGAVFTTARLLNAGATEVEIVTPAATLQTALAYSSFQVGGGYPVFFGGDEDYGKTLAFDAVTIENTASSLGQFIFQGDSQIIVDNGCRFIKWWTQLSPGVKFYIGDCTWDGRNESSFSGFLLMGDSSIRCLNTTKSWLIHDYDVGTAVFNLQGSGSEGQGMSAYLFAGAIDTVSSCIARLRGHNVQADISTTIEYTNPGPYAYVVEEGARMFTKSPGSMTDQTGTIGDIIIDGIAFTWEEVDADPNDIIIGPCGSWFGETVLTTPLDGTPTLSGVRGHMRYYQDAVPAISHEPSGTSQAIDWNDGEFQILDLDSASGTVGVTYSNMLPGVHYKLLVIQGATPREITHTTVSWLNENQPILYTAEDATHLFEMLYDGTTLYAWEAGKHNHGNLDVIANKIYFDSDRNTEIDGTVGGFLRFTVNGATYLDLAGGGVVAGQDLQCNRGFSSTTTNVDLVDSDATPSVAGRPFRRYSVANTSPTDITNLDGATEGELYILVGNSGGTNDPTITPGGNFALATGEVYTLTQDSVIGFLCVGTDSFVEMFRSNLDVVDLNGTGRVVLDADGDTYLHSPADDQVYLLRGGSTVWSAVGANFTVQKVLNLTREFNHSGATVFDADDGTPSVSSSYVCYSNPTNSAPFDITDLSGAVLNSIYELHGASGDTNYPTVKNGAIFLLAGGADFDLDQDAVLVIRCVSTGPNVFREISRSTNG